MIGDLGRSLVGGRESGEVWEAGEGGGCVTCDEGGLRRAPASSVVWLVDRWSSMEPHLRERGK